MKKIFCLFALLFAAWHSAAAYDFMVDGIAYNKSTTIKKAVEVAHLSYYAGRITIPPTVTYNNSYNEIEYFVTAIGDNAFSDCDKLTSISIPKTVTKIGNNAFMGCTGLTSINIPESVTSFGEHPFSNCPGLTSITVDSNNPVFDSRNNCNAIIETASNTLIHGCMNTVIPNSTTSIAGQAFCGHTGLTSIIIPESVKNISEYAFAMCSGLTSITIPESVKNISRYTFTGCSGLTSIIIPESVTWIGEYAFSGCSGLTEVSLGNSLSTIKKAAFASCTGLTSINIPKSVTTIELGAFGNCPSLTSITVDSNNPIYDSRNNCNAIIETESNYLYLGCKNTTIPNTVTYIEDDAFYGCTGLTEITLPESITEINSGAFGSCTNLTKVTSLNTTPPTITNLTFNAGVTVYVPASVVNAYRQAPGWKRLNIQALPSALPGDVDGDGVADITDINCITNVILGNEPASKYEGRADVNEDGNVDIDDLNIIIDTILGN